MWKKADIEDWIQRYQVTCQQSLTKAEINLGDRAEGNK
jgi:hypothetical protein